MTLLIELEGIPMEKVNSIDLNEAIEKQIAQKPANIKRDGATVSDAYCPRCEYGFPDIGGISEYYGLVEQYDYCPECGQKLDWSGE